MQYVLLTYDLLDIVCLFIVRCSFLLYYILLIVEFFMLNFWAILVMLCFCFFFFSKQKTAYEMRISDWSSDVCSSDLLDRVGGDIVAVAAAVVARLRAETDERGQVQPLRDRRAGRARREHMQPRGHLALGRFRKTRVEFRRDDEIGRASCRERVCQYV